MSNEAYTALQTAIVIVVIGVVGLDVGWKIDAANARLDTIIAYQDQTVDFLSDLHAEREVGR